MDNISRQRATLTSLAMLKVRADETTPQDYIDYLRPFAIGVLKKYVPNPVTREKLQELLLNDFGLQIPIRVCEILLTKLRDAGYLTASRFHYLLADSFPETDIETRRADASRRAEHVIHSLSSFAKSRYDKEFQSSEAISAFLAYLSQFSIDCLKAYSDGTILPDFGISPENGVAIVNAFIKDSITSSPALFDDIILVAKGHMLANALLCPDLDSGGSKFRDVTFYLDTPLVLDVLGLHGVAEQRSGMELLSAVKALGGGFSVFEHTLSEVRGVLTFCHQNFTNPWIRNRVLTNARRRSISASDIALANGMIVENLAEIHVGIQKTPKYDRDYQIDEKSLANVLETNSEYPNAYTRMTDINSIRSIYVLRSGTRPRRLEAAKGVLVTSNSRLAKRAYEFGKKFEESREVSPVIAEFSLGCIAWLKAPVSAKDLPRLEIIASCYAAFQPSTTFWEKFLKEVDRLKEKGKITEAQHEFMRSDYRIPTELATLTLGSEERLTESTVEKILENVTTELMAQKNAELGEKEQARKFEEAKRLGLEKELASVTQRLSLYTRVFAHILSAVLVLLLVAFLITGLFFPFLPEAWNNANSNFYKTIGLVVVAIFSIFNWLFGTSLSQCYQWLYTRVRSAVSKLLHAFVGLV